MTKKRRKMQLSDLKKTWSELSRTEKLGIIERSNDRRVQAFEERKSSGRKKQKKSGGSKKRKKRTPSTPEGILALKKDMSEEEWENLKMMLNSGQI